MVDLNRISHDGPAPAPVPILVAPRPLRISSAPPPSAYPYAPTFHRPAPVRLVTAAAAPESALERMSLNDEAVSPARSPTLSDDMRPGSRYVFVSLPSLLPTHTFHLSPHRPALTSRVVRSDTADPDALAPRPSLEAIEEFLSILKPAGLPPASMFAAPFLPRRSAPSPGRFSPARVPHHAAFDFLDDAGPDKENNGNNVVLVPRSWGPYGPLGASRLDLSSLSSLPPASTPSPPLPRALLSHPPVILIQPLRVPHADTINPPRLARLPHAHAQPLLPPPILRHAHAAATPTGGSGTPGRLHAARRHARLAAAAPRHAPAAAPGARLAGLGPAPRAHRGRDASMNGQAQDTSSSTSSHSHILFYIRLFSLSHVGFGFSSLSISFLFAD
jgi:hypothetical protein